MPSLPPSYHNPVPAQDRAGYRDAQQAAAVNTVNVTIPVTPLPFPRTGAITDLLESTLEQLVSLERILVSLERILAPVLADPPELTEGACSYVPTPANCGMDHILQNLEVLASRVENAVFNLERRVAFVKP